MQDMGKSRVVVLLVCVLFASFFIALILVHNILAEDPFNNMTDEEIATALGIYDEGMLIDQPLDQVPDPMITTVQNLGSEDPLMASEACVEITTKRLPKLSTAEIQSRCTLFVKALHDPATKAQIQAQYGGQIQELNERFEKLKKKAEELREQTTHDWLTDDYINSLPPEERAQFDHLSINQRRFMIQMSPEEREYYLDDLRKKQAEKPRELPFEERDVLQSKLTLAQVKQRTSQAHYQATMQEFTTYKKLEKTCTENCEQYKERARFNAQEHLTSLADMMLAELEILQVQSYQTALTVDEARLQNDSMTSLITAVTAQKTAISSAKTKEEIKSQATELLELWKSMQPALQEQKLKILTAENSRQHYSMQKTQERLELVIGRLRNDQWDFTVWQDRFDEIQQSITTAQERSTKIDALLAAGELEQVPTAQATSGKEVLASAYALHLLIRDLNGKGAMLDVDVEDEQPIDLPPLPENAKSDLKDKECIEEKPDFTEQGIYIWRGSCDHYFFVEWYGKGNDVDVVITTNGKFSNEDFDGEMGFSRMNFRPDFLSLRSSAYGDPGGITFKTTGNVTTFNITWDGVGDPSTVFLGKTREHPTSIPFSITTDYGVDLKVCKPDEFFARGICVINVSYNGTEVLA
jgi:hypothetical protein